MNERAGKHRDDPRIAMEGAVANDAAAAVVEVEHRREAQVDAASAQLGAEHVTGSARCLHRVHRAAAAAEMTVVHPKLAERAHRRQVGEAIGAKALHPAALVVDADEQVLADRLDFSGELGELLAVAPVAREQDDAPSERVLEAAAVFGVEREAGDVEDDRGVRVAHRGRALSTTTKVEA